MSKENIEKAVESDKHRALSRALYAMDGSYYVLNYDDEFVYAENYNKGKYLDYRLSYTYADGVAAITGEPEQVVMTEDTNYQPVLTKSLKDEIKDLVKSVLTPFSDKQTEDYDVVDLGDLEKGLYTVEPLYIGGFEVDGVGDAYYNSDEARLMVKELASSDLQGNYFHKIMTDDFQPVDAFYTERETRIEGTDTVIEANQPVVVIKYNSQAAYDLRKSNDLLGPSIGATVDEVIDVSTGEVLEKNCSIVLGSAVENNEKPEVVKRLLKGIKFNSPSAHLALTEKSQGGACSLKNDYYATLEKSMKKVLTESQKTLLEQAGHDVSDVEKSMEGSQTISNTEKEGNTDMSEQVIKDLQTRLNVAEAKEEFSVFGLEKSILNDLATCVADLKDKTGIVKAFEALAEQHKESLNKAKEAKETDDVNPLTKALEDEQGDPAEGEQEVNKTLSEQLAELAPEAAK